MDDRKFYPTESVPWWIPRTFAIGLAYFGAQMSLALYNGFLPIFYSAFVTSNTLIGLIMVIDNIASLTLQPYFAGLSDRTETRLGRRTPFLLVGIPIAALFFLLIPRAQGFWLLFLATIMVNAGGSVFNGPSIALMPDITPEALRSRANGILNLMAGLGVVVASFVLSRLYDRSRTLPFDVASLLLLGALAVILLTVRERRLSRQYRGDQTPTPAPDAVQAGRLLQALRMVVANRDRSVLFLLLGGLTWVAAVNGVQNMFTRYGVNYLGLSPSGALYLLGFFAASFLVFAVPAGIVGDRIGRLPAIRLGVAGTLIVFLAISYVRDPGLYRVILVVGGLCWALWVVNAYPYLLDRIPPSQTGIYTGLWTSVLGLGGLISPPLFGVVVDTWGFRAFFAPGIALMAVGLAFTLGLHENRRRE